MKKPLISIIMPAYNSECYINTAIDSVLNQTYENWELIICDDCSTDRTKKIINEYHDKRIKKIYLEKNSGVTIARNKSINYSKGSYYAFLDSDDYWKPTKLEKQLKFMQDKNIKFSCTSYGIVRKNLETNKVFKASYHMNYTDYLKNTSIGNSSVMLSSDVEPDFKIEEGPLEDVVTWIKLLKKNIDCYGILEPLTMYRISEGSVSSNKVNNAMKYFKLLNRRENINFISSCYYEFCYMFNAIIKRIK